MFQVTYSLFGVIDQIVLVELNNRLITSLNNYQYIQRDWLILFRNNYPSVSSWETLYHKLGCGNPVHGWTYQWDHEVEIIINPQTKTPPSIHTLSLHRELSLLNHWKSNGCLQHKWKSVNAMKSSIIVMKSISLVLNANISDFKLMRPLPPNHKKSLWNTLSS